MAEDIAISVNDVSKMYKLYDNPMDRLKEMIPLISVNLFMLFIFIYAVAYFHQQHAYYNPN